MEAESGHVPLFPVMNKRIRLMSCLVPFRWVEFGQNDPVTSLMPGLKRVKDVNGAVKNPACQ